MQRILVVDDSELNRELLREMLSADYAIETAEDGLQAVSALEARHTRLAALLLDLQMPRADGFHVIAEMKRRGWMTRIPVLVISGEQTAEVETRCLALGVSDFIHKPFDASIVRNRVRNAVELFVSRNRLAQTVELQAARLKRQSEIIQQQAEKLRRNKHFDALMLEYRAVLMELDIRLKVLNDVFSAQYRRNPFESIKSRLKSAESIFQKLERKGFAPTVENIRAQLSDVAGLRVVCAFPDDIYRVADLLTKQDDITVLREKDYIKNPKPNGYRSLHLILHVPVFLPDGKKLVKAEVQFRTIAMDFWASVEHKLKYKKDLTDSDEIGRLLKKCASSIEELDYQMQEIRNRIDSAESSRREDEAIAL